MPPARLSSLPSPKPSLPSPGEPPPYPGPSPSSSSSSYPAAPYPALPTLVTTTTTTTTTTITTQVQETKHLALFSGLALPGLGLLRRKSTSRPGSAGSSGSGSQEQGRSPVSPTRLSPARGEQASPARLPLPPSPTNARTSIDRSLLLSKPLPPSPPSPPAPDTSPAPSPALVPTSPEPHTPLHLPPPPQTPAVTLTPSSPPPLSDPEPSPEPGSTTPTHPPPVPPGSASAYRIQSSLALQGLGLSPLTSPLTNGTSSPSPAGTLSPTSALGPSSAASSPGPSSSGLQDTNKRFSIRRARSFDRPSSTAAAFQGSFVSFNPSPSPSSSSSPAAAAAAPAGAGGKVHFAPAPSRSRRPRTATLPVPPHLSVADISQGEVDLGAGGGRGRGWDSQQPLPALPAMPALPAPVPAQEQQQQEGKVSFWRRRRMSTSRPGSRGKDSPAPVPALTAEQAPAGGPPAGRQSPAKRFPSSALPLEDGTPSPPLTPRSAVSAHSGAGGSTGTGLAVDKPPAGMWEKAARRRASSAFLRFAGMGRDSDSDRERERSLLREKEREKERERESWEMMEREAASMGVEREREEQERERERERGRRRASTLLSPVQIRPAQFQSRPPVPVLGPLGELANGNGLQVSAGTRGSPLEGAFAFGPLTQDSLIADSGSGWSPAPSPSNGTAPSPSPSTPAAPTPPPPRSRSTTLDSLTSLATSFPWARNSLLLTSSNVIPPGPGSGSDPATPALAPSPPAGPVRRPSLSRIGLLGMGMGKKSGSVPAGLGSVLHENGSAPSGLGQEVDEETRERERERDPRRRRTQEEVEREVELERVVRTVSRAELAEVLCGTPLLSLHLARITPSPFPAPQLYSPGLPLDISLRVLLMHLALPKETQAIDRFVETFASTWAERYPRMVTTDQAYILAFSMIMLHTDHFNPSNKRKMSREDYVRNTRRDGGVPDVVLEYFYDNITFTRFIFVEDAVDVHGQRSLMPAADISPSGISVSPAASASSGGRSKGKKIDVYYLIAQGRLDPLRAPVGAWIPAFEPFSYAGAQGGSADDWVERCNEAFAGAAEVRVDSVSGRSTSGLASLGNFGTGGGVGTNGIGTASMTEAQDGGMVLKLTKVGALLRRQDTGEGGRKSSHKWRNLGVAITGSQLLFFKDPNWIVNLKDSADSARRVGGQPPRLASFRPDDWVSLRDAVALYDTTYLEHEHTFRLVLPHQKQYLFQVAGEDELGEWMAFINYAASFKTAGVRMRSAGMTSRQLGLAALAAAESHVREVRSASGASSPAYLSRVVSLDDTPPTTSPGELTPVESGTDSATAVSNSPSLPSLPDPADQLEATFREIKAELAAIRPGMADIGLGVPPLAAARRSPAARAQSLFVGSSAEHPPEMVRSSSLGPLMYSSVNSSGEFSIRKGWLASRSEVIERKIASFEQDIAKLEPHLEADLRAARNLAMLTPFLKSTREKINAAVQPLARRVTQLRMDLARLRCYCDVLRSDLDAEQREWAETKQSAFDAAEARLGGRGRGLRVEVPRMTLSMHLESPREMDTDSADGHRYLPTAGRPASTMTNESYHSAVDTPADERTWSPEHSPGFQSPMSLFRSRSTLGGSISTTAGLSDGIPTPTNGRFSAEITASPTSPAVRVESIPEVGASPLSTPAAEEETAEDWEATRAAKRVSLVQIPSSGLHPRLSVHSQQSSGSGGSAH